MPLLSPSKSPRVSAKKEHLLETAWRLFYQHGFHATGIDRILAEADVAKMTLYKHFRSKEELILAILRKRSCEFRESLAQFLEAKKQMPEQRLLAVFDWLIDWVGRREFRGCVFLKALAEYQEGRDPVHQAALAHKVAFNEEIRRLTVAAGLTRPKSLPDQLSLLIEGAIVKAHATGTSAPALQAREAARILIKSAKRSGAATKEPEISRSQRRSRE